MSNTETIFLSGLFLLITSLIFTFIYKKVFHIDSGSTLLFLIMFLGFLLIIFTYFYQFYDFEKIKNEKNGFLELDANELIINYNEKIIYEEITDFELLIDAYYNKKINMIYRNPTEKRSLGISNSLTITHKSKTRTFNFKLESKSHQNVLERNIYNLVINDKLRNIDGKKSIKLIPKQYKGFEEYREYIGKQLKEKKINCTEGLLLMGYKSYDEAQELKRKYCV
ncbi:hypothetical protein MHL31_03010 [Lutibacter sp. A80]|uniref:hypothetical protein n=1 Tax=Lutibacter sp. A80 TaxID=2918453 RepID=UPI001F068392|nr:hypothetical protein [Lutibacter sp. A80]UMB61182.1 hypothetical protein MHL31_03010 [Lutibacter sp. A80]